MHTKLLRLVSFAVVPVIALALASCNKGVKGEEETMMIETPNGAAVIETYQVTATVTAIDSSKRKITLTGPDGGTTVVKAGKGVPNFNQLKVGDKVTATVGEEFAATLRPSNAPPSVGEGAAVAEAVTGNERDVFMADSVQATARITNVDAKHHKVTLQFADGKSKTLKVGKHVDLSQVKAGDDVTVSVTEAVAIDVRK